MNLVLSEACALYRPLLYKTADIYGELVLGRDELRDGQSNCWLIAGIGLGVARALGFNALAVGGKTIDAEGRAGYRGGEHYWVALPDGVIMDGPRADTVWISPPSERHGWRYVPLKRVQRKVKDLEPIAAAAERRIQREQRLI